MNKPSRLIHKGEQLDVEVDQSIKIEQTSKDTILAFSNDEQVAILIPAKVKRQVLVRLNKAKGKPMPVARLMLFSVGLCLLLREAAQNLTAITIDQEYPGHEADIRGMLLRFLRKIGMRIDKEGIVFARVGKCSRAHERAWRVHRGEIAPDRTVTLQELLDVLQ